MGALSLRLNSLIVKVFHRRGVLSSALIVKGMAKHPVPTLLLQYFFVLKIARKKY